MRTLLLEGAERLPRWLRTRHSPDTSYQEKLTISSMALGCLTPFGCIHQRFVGLSSPKLANLAPSFSPRYSALHNRTNRAKLTPPWFLPAWLLLVRKVDGFPPMRLARPFGYLQGRRRSDSPRRASARSAVLVVCSGGRAPFGYMVARYDAQNPFRGLPPPITVFEFSTLVVAEKCRLGPRAGFQPAVGFAPARVCSTCGCKTHRPRATGDQASARHLGNSRSFHRRKFGQDVSPFARSSARVGIYGDRFECGARKWTRLQLSTTSKWFSACEGEAEGLGLNQSVAN